MSTFDFDHVNDRSASLSVKWNKDAIRAVCNNPEALPFWVADMDFSAPPAVLEALRKQTDHGVFGYPYFESLPQHFASWALERHQWDVDTASVVITPGILTSLALLIELLTETHDGVILPLPAYRPFFHIITSLGRTIVPWPMRYDETDCRFSLDMEALSSLMAEPANRLLLFCSPHNPTGLVFSEAVLDEIADLAARYGTTVISDEIHADLVFPGIIHTPFDVVARRHGIQAVTCMAPSKTFNIPGEHFSVAVFSQTETKKLFITRMESLHLRPTLLSTVTAVAAYQGGRAWLTALVDYLEKQASHIGEYLESHCCALSFVKPQASFIGLIDCQWILEKVRLDAALHSSLYEAATSPEGGLLSRFFGQRAGVAMHDGTWFGSPYERFVRFNYGTSRRTVDEALSRIAQAVSSLHVSFPTERR